MSIIFTGNLPTLQSRRPFKTLVNLPSPSKFNSGIPADDDESKLEGFEKFWNFLMSQQKQVSFFSKFIRHFLKFRVFYSQEDIRYFPAVEQALQIAPQFFHIHS